MESLLGAVLSCPDSAVQQVIADIKQDDLAREILNRVDTGPFVSVNIHCLEETVKSIFRAHRADFHSQLERRRKTSLRVYSEVTKLLLVILHALEGNPGFREKSCLLLEVSSHRRSQSSIKNMLGRQYTFNHTNVGVAGSPVCSSGERSCWTPQCLSDLPPQWSSFAATASARHTVRQQ